MWDASPALLIFTIIQRGFNIIEEIILSSKRLNLNAWRLTLESRRLTLELWRLTY
jgi:hypothetical protein